MKNNPLFIYFATTVAVFLLSAYVFLPWFEVDLTLGETITISLLQSQSVAVVAYVISNSALNNRLFWNSYYELEKAMKQNPDADFSVAIEQLKGMAKAGSHHAAISNLLNK